jgi:hypothetical protein
MALADVRNPTHATNKANRIKIIHRHRCADYRDGWDKPAMTN